jgi:hypothetical protein
VYYQMAQRRLILRLALHIWLIHAVFAFCNYLSWNPLLLSTIVISWMLLWYS